MRVSKVVSTRHNLPFFRNYMNWNTHTATLSNKYVLYFSLEAAILIGILEKMPIKIAASKKLFQSYCFPTSRSYYLSRSSKKASISSNDWLTPIITPSGFNKNLEGTCFTPNSLAKGEFRNFKLVDKLSLIHIWRCRRSTLCRSRWSPYH